MSYYAEQAKKLLSVCTRLEKWFAGERLYESVEAESDDGEFLFRWNYRTKHFEYISEITSKWQRVVQPHNPLVMARFMSVMPELHKTAQQKKLSVADTLYIAASAGEEYLQKISGFVDDDLGEQETSDNE